MVNKVSFLRGFLAGRDKIVEMSIKKKEPSSVRKLLEAFF